MPDPLLIFDCDGVLVDSELISLGLLIDHCADCGLTLDLAMACEFFLGNPVADAAKEANRIHNTSIPDVDLEDFQREIVKQFKEQLQPVPGIADALRQLRNPKCVASSSNMSRIKTSVQLTDLADFFQDKLHSADMVTLGKPHPDVFLYAAREIWGARPRRHWSLRAAGRFESRASRQHENDRLHRWQSRVSC